MRNTREDKEIEEILNDIFLEKYITDPVYCRFCGEVMDRSETIAHLNTYSLEFTTSPGYTFLKAGYRKIGKNKSGKLIILSKEVKK